MNPAINEIGLISKNIVDKINYKLRDSLRLTVERQKWSDRMVPLEISIMSPFLT